MMTTMIWMKKKNGKKNGRTLFALKQKPMIILQALNY